MLGMMILAVAFLVILHIITVGLLNMGCVDEELWEEVGDEVPAAWDDSLESSKAKGKPVPPGKYFTVIKGCYLVSSLSSHPILLFGIACMLTPGHTPATDAHQLTWMEVLQKATHFLHVQPHSYFNATATETGFIIAQALCCYGKTCVITLIVLQDMLLLLADSRNARTLGYDVWPIKMKTHHQRVCLQAQRQLQLLRNQPCPSPSLQYSLTNISKQLQRAACLMAMEALVQAPAVAAEMMAVPSATAALMLLVVPSHHLNQISHCCPKQK